jgi:hypothetical protein
MGKARYPFKQDTRKVDPPAASIVGAPEALKWRIFLTGICALTPGGPDPESVNRDVQGPLHVVMPASTLRRSRRSPNVVIPVHLPFAVIPIRNLSPANTRPIDMRVTDREGNDQAIFIFSRERLSFKDAQKGPITFHQSNKAPSQAPSGSNDQRDVNWIVDLRKVWAEASTIKNECLPTNNDFPLPAAVGAQLTIGRGTVMTEFPSANHPIVTFQPSKGTVVSQVITRQCVVEQELPAVGEITFQSTSIDEGEAMTPIVLTTVSGSHLEMTIGNADFDDIRAIAMKDIPPINLAPVDFDFELYREILEVPDEQADFPVPVSIGRQGSHDSCPVVKTGGG